MKGMDTTTYKQRLLTEKTTLEEELSTVGMRNPSNAADWIPTPDSNFDSSDADPNVAADAVEEFAGRSAIVADLEARLQSVTHALNKIEAGTYGTCEISNEPIESLRLDADPAARTCTKHLSETLPPIQ